MKKTIKNLILILILMLTTSAFCYEITQNELKQTISEKIEKSIKNEYKNISNDIEILTTIPYISINTNEKPIIELDSNFHTVKNIIYNKIYIKNSKGNLLKTINIVSKIKIYKNILVAKENINFGSEINSSNTKFEKKDISVLAGFFETLDNSLISNTNFKVGDVIISTKTKQKPLIVKNSTVDVVFNSNNLKIKIQARALQNGAMNEKITVRSDKFNKIYTGKVISKYEVMVGS